MKAEAEDKKVTDILPDDSRQKAAKFIFDAMSPEEKAKFLESMQKEPSEKKTDK